MSENWLTRNAEAIKAAGSIIQSVAIAGGIIAAVYGFILSPQVEERQRVQNTIPYIKDAYADKLNQARDSYRNAAAAFVEEMILKCGRVTRCEGWVDEGNLLQMERQMSKALRPLAQYYSQLARCVESDICSSLVVYKHFCGDATEIYEGVTEIRGYVLDRVKWQAIGVPPEDASDDVMQEYRERETRFGHELEKFQKDMERNSRVLEGLGAFAKQCLDWNVRNPDRQVDVTTDPFIVYL